MKKKILMHLLVISLCFIASPVFAERITSCDAVFDQIVVIDYKIPKLISLIVTIIKIVIPILLVILGMLDLLKSVTAGKEDEIKKGYGIIIKRLIAAIVVFFIFSIVQTLINFVSGDPGIMTCVNCFVNGECSCAGSNCGTGA